MNAETGRRNYKYLLLTGSGDEVSVFKASLVCSAGCSAWGWAAVVVSMIGSICDEDTRVESRIQGAECGFKGGLNKNEHCSTGGQWHQTSGM